MMAIDRLKASFPRAAAAVETHVDFLRKAVSFALIGVVNVGVDGGVFFVAYAWLAASAAVLRPLDAVSQWCGCMSSDMLVLSAANVISWAVAVSGSYLMNTFITFAAESGRRLRWRDYRKFVASGVLGVIVSTAALLAAREVMPVLPAKLCAILAAFVVNFGMSHFVVFRTQRVAPESPSKVVAGE